LHLLVFGVHMGHAFHDSHSLVRLKARKLTHSQYHLAPLSKKRRRRVLGPHCNTITGVGVHTRGRVCRPGGFSQWLGSALWPDASGPRRQINSGTVIVIYDLCGLRGSNSVGSRTYGGATGVERNSQSWKWTGLLWAGILIRGIPGLALIVNLVKSCYTVMM
jgi:hypothetical protein